MKWIYTSLIALFCLGLSAQKKEARIIDWKLLSKVKFEDRYFPKYEAWYLVPKFSPEVKALDGKEIIIKGYVIPFDVEGGLYALSAYPFSECFFCGGAGPESVMSLHFEEKPPRYETDAVMRFTGRLELNDTDTEDFNYILRDCRPLP